MSVATATVPATGIFCRDTDGDVIDEEKRDLIEVIACTLHT